MKTKLLQFIVLLLMVSVAGATIISPLPNIISNGQPADATVLMADLNWIVNQTNANGTPITGGSPTFTSVTVTGQLTSTQNTGSPPFVVTSTTPVSNLNIGGNAATSTFSVGATSSVSTDGLNDNAGIVNVSAANSPVAGAVLTATGTTTANWQIIPNGFSVTPTWHNETVGTSRVLGTSYTNSTGNIMQLAITGGAATGTMTVVVDGVTLPALSVSCSCGYNIPMSMYPMIPNGSTYVVTGSVIDWAEFY